MKLYLKKMAQELKNYTKSLDRESFLMDKPWVVMDNEFELQRLIFKRNKRLILSKNGNVQEGSWEYLIEVNSLLIDRGTDKILCNVAFANKGVLILRLDGTEEHFFSLANEDIIPDLDVETYLKKLRYKEQNIAEVKLRDGITLEVSRRYPFEINVKDLVYIDSKPVNDGIYQLSDRPNEYYEIKDSQIESLFIEKKYVNPENQEIRILQHTNWEPRRNDLVYLNNQLFERGVLNFSKLKELEIQEGKLVKLRYKNKFLRALLS